MLYFKHKDSSKNIGLKAGKKFVAIFEIRSYVDKNTKYNYE